MNKVLLGLFLLLTIGCGTYVKQPVASHVVAVTLEGDTILVAIDKIRPNQYINFYPVYSRPYYYPYYNNYIYQWRNFTNEGTYSSSNSSGYRTPPPKSIPVISPPDITTRPSATVLRKK